MEVSGARTWLERKAVSAARGNVLHHNVDLAFSFLPRPSDNAMGLDVAAGNGNIAAIHDFADQNSSGGCCRSASITPSRSASVWDQAVGNGTRQSSLAEPYEKT